uniref:Transmembrane protein 130 n=1 Tax=Salvator merianae TaxID=96440 RepID=A0A8D0E3Q7_SALMN
MTLTPPCLSLPGVVCGLLLLSYARASAEPYYLEVTNSGPITTNAQATVYSTLHPKHGGVFPADDRKYKFNWFYAPLILVEKSEHRRSSTIVVTSTFPGIFPVSVLVTQAGCWFCHNFAQNLTVLQVSEFIVGNLSVTQVEDDGKTGKFNTSPTAPTLARLSFLLHDPSHYFKLASFTYHWDFGDGTYLTTDEPSVDHNYSSAGTFVVHLDVIAEIRAGGTSVEQQETVVRKTGHFAAALDLLGAVRSINIVGSTETQVMENLNLSLYIQGSPPLSLCWLIKTECIDLEGDHCHLVVVNTTSYNLNHVFNEAGQYCLSVRVENGVNMLQSFQEIQVKPLSGIHPAFYALPCVSLFLAILGLAAYMTFRSSPPQKDLVEVADFDFSPMADKTPAASRWSCSQLCCQTCFLGPSVESCEAIREHHRLLYPLYKPMKMYTV